MADGGDQPGARPGSGEQRRQHGGRGDAGRGRGQRGRGPRWNDSFQQPRGGGGSPGMHHRQPGGIRGPPMGSRVPQRRRRPSRGGASSPAIKDTFGFIQCAAALGQPWTGLRDLSVCYRTVSAQHGRLISRDMQLCTWSLPQTICSSLRRSADFDAQVFFHASEVQALEATEGADASAAPASGAEALQQLAQGDEVAFVAWPPPAPGAKWVGKQVRPACVEGGVPAWTGHSAFCGAVCRCPCRQGTSLLNARPATAVASPKLTSIRLDMASVASACTWVSW